MNTQEIRTKILDGERITREEGIFLYKEADLLMLGECATAVRQRVNPGKTVTYLIDRNINYTNVCNTDCSFCAFYRPSSSHKESYVLSKEILGKKIQETIDLGGTRILLQGGHNDDLPFDYYTDLISWIHQNYKIEINSFSPSEIEQMQKVSGKSYLEILSTLKECGMRGLPGGGGEILDDEIRHRVSPKKTKADEWIAVMEVAQSLGLTTTATMVIGFGESVIHRFNHFDRLRSLQDRSQKAGHEGFNAFISWILQHNENTSMGRSRHASNYGTSLIEYFRNMAIARIYLDNIPHHQASWPTAGPEVAQLGLTFGCDDFGSTMMEENVVSKAGGYTAKQWIISPEEMKEHIREAGFEPAQRDTSFNRVAS